MGRLRAGVRARPGAAADLTLLAITFTWGTSFALQKVALREMGAGVFNAFRFGAAVLVLGLLFLPELRRARRRDLLVGGAIGLVLGASMFLQSLGLRQTSASVGGFISGLPVVFTPLLAIPLLGERPTRWMALSVALATVGLALMSLTEDLRLGPGDLLVAISSAGFALQIVLTGRYAARIDPRVMGTMQSFGAFVACLPPAILLDRLPSGLSSEVVTITLYLGIVNLGFVWVLQSWAQRHVSATRTALIYTMEPVFAALFATLLLSEWLAPRAAMGAVVVLAAMLAATIGQARRSRSATRGTIHP